jgi:hypothetical protein
MSTTSNPALPHPAPSRHHVALLALVFGVAGAPAAWGLHLVANFALASQTCSPGRAWNSAIAHSGLHGTMLASAIAAIAICSLALWVSYNSWRMTHDETRGNHHRLLDVGEGRTRFLGMVGMVLSGGFLAATLFDAIALFVVPLCH